MTVATTAQLVGGTIFFFLGVCLVIAGVSFRAGHIRQLAHHGHTAVFYMRNLALGLIPTGLAGVFLGLGGILISGGNGESAVFLVFLGAAFAAVAILVMLIAPNWAKPSWMRHTSADDD